MPNLTIALTIAPQTPLSVGAGGSTGVLADKVCLRDGYGRLILPGSQIKGKLRHACEAILRGLGRRVCHSPRAEEMCGQDEELCAICLLFGSPHSASRLTFADLVYHDPVGGLDYDADQPRWDEQAPLRPGIGVARRRGTVAENLLFFTETSPAVVADDPDGTVGTFTNAEAITGRVPTLAHARLLMAGLSYIPAWGGGKSRGLGWAWVRAVADVGEVLTLDTLAGSWPSLSGLEALKEL